MVTLCTSLSLFWIDYIMSSPAPARGKGPEGGRGGGRGDSGRGDSDGGCGQGPLGSNWKGSTTGRVTRANPTGASNQVEIPKDTPKLSGILQQNNTQVQQKLDNHFTTKTKDTEDKTKDTNTDESPQKKPKSDISHSTKLRPQMEQRAHLRRFGCDM